MAAQRDDGGIRGSASLNPHQQILDAVGDVVYTVDHEGYLAYINARVEDMLGYTPDEMIGHHFERYIAPTWCDHARNQYSLILKQQEQRLVIALPVIQRNTDRLWVEQVISPLYDNQGAVAGVIAVMRDITTRELTDETLENRVNQLATLQRVDAELTHQLDVDYVLLMALDAVTRLSTADAGGIELIKDGELYTGKLIGAYPREFAHYPKPPTDLVKRVLERREAELIPDVTVDPDYYSYIEDTRARMTIPLLSQDRLIGVLFLETRRPERFTQDAFEFTQLVATRIAVAVDNAQLYATSRQQLAELQDLYRQITTLEQLKTDMIRIAAHDLGNPLTSISGFTDMLLESDMGETQKEYAALVKDAAVRMKKIIRNILSLQRIEEIARGGLNEEVDLVALVQQVFATQAYPAEHKHQEFVLECEPVPLPVRGDSAQLHEAITNLISNALKYTPEYGRIVVKVWEHYDIVYFSVTDNGYGIPKDQQDRLFRPFFRAVTSETEDIEGNGLGLHLVKNIIERHGGKMHVESDYGEGSTFGFEIPLYVGD